MGATGTKSDKRRPLRARDKGRAGRALGWALVLAGAAVLMFPLMSQRAADRAQAGVVETYDAAAAAMATEDQAAARAAAEAWNEGLSTGHVGDEEARQASLEAEAGSAMDLSGDGVICTLRIPEIDVRLPVYPDVDEASLVKGVGHLPETSLPVGGPGTHSVLTAHNGLTTATLFSELNALEEDSVVLVDVLGETMAYKVTSKQVVEPTENWGYAIVPGRDLLTLVTCTPFGVNSHRLLVHCERTEYAPGLEETSRVLPYSLDPRTYAGAVGAAGAAAAVWRILVARKSSKVMVFTHLHAAPWGMTEKVRPMRLEWLGAHGPEVACRVPRVR